MLLCVILLAACAAPPPAATEVPQAVKSTVTPKPTFTLTLTPNYTLTPTSTLTVSPSSTASEITSVSPDGKYMVSIAVDYFPFELVIVEVQSEKTTSIPLMAKDMNVIEEIAWSPNDNFVAIILYKDPNQPPYPESNDSFEERFILVNIPENKVVGMYDGGSHVYKWSEQNIITLEHAGLNDIFDYYFVDVDCYKQFFEYECLNTRLTSDWEFYTPQWSSEVFKWEFEVTDPDEIPDDQFFAVAFNSQDGTTWKYTNRVNKPDTYADAKEIYLDKNREDVYFSPIGYDESTYFYYGLLKMHLANGEITEVIPNTLAFTEKYYDLAIAPSGNKVIFIDKSKPGKQVIVAKNLFTGEEKRIPFHEDNSIKILPNADNIENPLLTSNIFWSPDENKVAVVNAILDPATWGEKVVANCFFIDFPNDKIIQLVQNSDSYYSVFDMSNGTVSLLDLGAANLDFGNGNILVFSLDNGKLISETTTPQ